MTSDEPRLTISVVVPDGAREHLAAYRDNDPGPDTLGLVDERVEKGRARINGRAAGEGTATCNPDGYSRIVGVAR